MFGPSTVLCCVELDWWEPNSINEVWNRFKYISVVNRINDKVKTQLLNKNNKMDKLLHIDS